MKPPETVLFHAVHFVHCDSKSWVPNSLQALNGTELFFQIIAPSSRSNVNWENAMDTL